MTAGLVAPLLMDGMSKDSLKEHDEADGDYVRNKLFDRKQFVTDADLRLGGRIQRLATEELNIVTAARQRMFWEEGGGRATVRNTIRKKRQATQNSMKLAFRGK